MSKDILGSIMRILTTIKPERLVLVHQFALKLSGPDDKEWEGQAKRFIRRLPSWDEASMQRSAAEGDETMDTMIRVDRSFPCAYPTWIKEHVCPELENTGPAEYDFAACELWLHDGQKGSGMMRGERIFASLSMDRSLGRFIGFRDLKEILKKGPVFFKKYVKGHALYGWRSIVMHRNGRLRVPYIYIRDGNVKLGWRWLVYCLNCRDPSLKFAAAISGQ